MKKNLKEKLIYRKIKTPNRFIASIVFKSFKHLAKKRNVHFEYDFDCKKIRKKQIILLSQHCSRDEYIYVLAGMTKYDLHCIIGYQNFFDKSTYSLLLKLGTIAKYLYQPDPIATKQMLRVVHMGESLLIFPEGIQSTSGATQPINPATMKFLMKCKLPVVLCTSHGSYLTRPRYSPEKRIGQMTFSYKLLFSEEDYQNCTQEQLYAKLLENFRYNEFEYNRQAKIPFKGKCENIDGLDNIIYKCPHCNEEFSFAIEGDTMRCEHCGYTVRIDEYYNLQQVNFPLVFDDIDKWYNWQRRQVAQEVLQEGFAIKSQVTALDINLQKLKNCPDEVGEGELTITNHTITYSGTHRGKDVQLEFDIAAIPSLSFSPLDHSVDMYYNNEYFCFAPKQNKLQVVKWMLATEEINSLHNEQWAKARKEVYDN